MPDDGIAVAAPGRIFISYRREETAYPAGWLFDRLADHFGVSKIFKDVDSIEPGDDFVETIRLAVGSCEVLLALIGDEWLTIAAADGGRRLDDPNDFVRLEIEAALSRGVRVIPILVEGARMPRADELPDSLAGLVRRQALELSPSRFDADLARLLKVLDRTLGEQPPRPPACPPGRPPGSPRRSALPPCRRRPSRWRPRRRTGPRRRGSSSPERLRRLALPPAAPTCPNDCAASSPRRRGSPSPSPRCRSW